MPCAGADKEEPADRPVLTVAQGFDLAGRMPARFRAMVLLAAFAFLRWGEVSALRRCDIADDGSWLRISRAFVESTEKGMIVGPPKSKAGARTLMLPTAVRAVSSGTWRLTPRARGTRSCSPARTVGRCVGRTSTSE